MSLPRYDICKECGNMISNLSQFFMNSCDKCDCTAHERKYIYLEHEAKEKQKEVLKEIRNRKIDDLLGE